MCWVGVIALVLLRTVYLECQHYDGCSINCSSRYSIHGFCVLAISLVTL